MAEQDYRLVRLTPGPGPDIWPLPVHIPTRIGRATEVHAVGVDLSADRTVSRRHAELRFVNDGWQICDLGSKLGTYVGGRRLSDNVQVECPSGVEIRIGAAGFCIFSRDWHRLRAGEVIVDLAVSPRYGASLAATGVKLVPHLVVRNWSPTAVGPGRLEIQLHGVGGVFVDVRRLHEGESHVANLPSPAEPKGGVRPAAGRRGVGPQTVEVIWNGERIDAGKLRCAALSDNEWSCLPEHFLSLATFVQPDHPRVVELAREATAGAALRAGSDALLHRLYAHLAGIWRIDYRKDPPPNRAQTQKLRSPEQILWDSRERRGQGTCLDLAVLIAAGLETLRLQPLIAIVDLGTSWHALVGCWRMARRRLDPLPTDCEALCNDATWIDPNGCTRDPRHRSAIDVAGQRALQCLRERPLILALDLATARAHGSLPLASRRRPRWNLVRSPRK